MPERPGTIHVDVSARVDRASLALAHLRLRLAPLQRALRAAAERRTERNARLTRPDLTPFCVTDEQVAALLDDVAASLVPDPGDGGAAPTAIEGEQERELRRLASAAGLPLPLDELAARLRLRRAEQDVLTLIAMPDLDAGYERIFAYVVDDLNRRVPGVELLTETLGGGPAVSRMLTESAPLRRYGLVRALPGDTSRTSQEFRLGDGVLEVLLGWSGEAGLVARDPGEVTAPPGWRPPANLDPDVPARIGPALSSGRLDLFGVWGAAAAHRDAALAVAAAADRPLRVLSGGPAPDELTSAVRIAADLGAILWIPADEVRGGPAERAIVELLGRTRLPVVVTGTAPWRPVPLLAHRAYAEVTLPAPDHRQRRAAWSAALPQLTDEVVTDLAARFRMSGDDLRAVAAVAETGARFAGNGQPDRIENHLPGALAAVTRGHNSAYARTVAPRHTLDDLVLPPEQHRRVLEIAAAFRAWPRVAEAWGFSRRAGDSGVKVLFTGEPGTGKTLTAEIIAGRLGLDLLKVDLSQLVSKWVGETEKNLELVFRQAEESQAVMFFDEADSLFGKRGDVRHGTDRYANLEVGYLLQRLESSDALIILASNLRENIDVGFTRRFHFVVNFVRPGQAERLRLWRAVFPPEAPLEADVDMAALARLDMTGAGIASAARSAALIAADAGRAIAMRDVVAGVTRQYQREARLLRAADLGGYASLLDGPARPDKG
ncbi:ATP-binding protein [Actinoplanes aureus]|uniref:ATP-binding protein n=1 Tax=Actinoplanes aureus TaxID=2792083 RepID=A0A931C3T6_9ACTN|nr:ATP-binding protein [Actinoplanes aureus]MBG0562869.1 ATP-binding protein [Actinoplanes aureus]